MLIALTAFDQSANQKETKTMTPQPFLCALAKDHNPPLVPEADKYFQEAIALEKTNGWEDWPKIINLYEKTIELNHWKATYNLC